MKVLINNFNIQGDEQRISEFPGLEKSLYFAQEYFKDLEAFEPVSSMKDVCKNLESVLRDVDTRIDRRNILYLVTDKCLCNEKKDYLPMRLKGFFQKAGEDNLVEFQHSAYRFIMERYGWKVNMDLVE